MENTKKEFIDIIEEWAEDEIEHCLSLMELQEPDNAWVDIKDAQGGMWQVLAVARMMAKYDPRYKDLENRACKTAYAMVETLNKMQWLRDIAKKIRNLAPDEDIEGLNT